MIIVVACLMCAFLSCLMPFGIDLITELSWELIIINEGLIRYYLAIVKNNFQSSFLAFDYIFIVPNNVFVR